LSDVDLLYERMCAGDTRAFERWMGRVERPICLSLRRYARAVDVEGVVQETLKRMWILATRGERTLEGPCASLRFAIGMARNIARNEARRFGRIQYLPPEDLPEPESAPAPTPDHGLRRAILECLELLAGKPRLALMARVTEGHREPDRTLAERLDMKLNTFLQNVVRARRQVGECLEGKGVPLGEARP
jgi:DNA-directed RNA polymerase specialized sigma24 family protein